MTRIVTFYSFKGGVGRTQALANVALSLANRGLNVVALDMDLESPGLHSFFQPVGHAGWGGFPGLLEHIDAWRTSESEPRIVDRLTAATHARLQRGTLRLLLPGQLDARYPARAAALSWDTLVQKEDGDVLLSRLREQLRTLDADIVLIDSRTGITDVGNLCTFFLPDLVVIMFALHEQGIAGAALVANAIRQNREPERALTPEVILLPARVEETDGLQVAYWKRRYDTLAEFGELFGEPGQRIPYDRQVAFGESAGLEGDIAAIYNRLAARILGGEPPVVAERTGLEALRRDVKKFRVGVETLQALTDGLTPDALPLWEIGRRLRQAEDQQQALGAAYSRLNRLFQEAQPPPVPEVSTGWGRVLVQVETTLSIAEAALGARKEELRAELLVSAEGDAAAVELEVADLIPALEEGDEPTVVRLVAESDARLRRQAVQGLLDMNVLEIQRLQSFLPEAAGQARWLDEQLRREVQEGSPTGREQRVRRLRNLLRLRIPSLEFAESLHWQGYEALCASHEEAQADYIGEFARAGSVLWTRAWEALGRGVPRSEALPMGPLAHTQLEWIEVEAPALLEGVAATAAATLTTFGPLQQTVAFGPDDPIVRAAMAVLVRSLTADHALLARWVLTRGRGEADAEAGWVDALAAAGCPVEAFLAALTPSTSDAGCRARLQRLAPEAVLALVRAGDPLVDRLVVQDGIEEVLTATPRGRVLALVLRSGWVGSPAPWGRPTLPEEQADLRWVLDHPVPRSDQLRQADVVAAVRAVRTAIDQIHGFAGWKGAGPLYVEGLRVLLTRELDHLLDDEPSAGDAAIRLRRIEAEPLCRRILSERSELGSLPDGTAKQNLGASVVEVKRTLQLLLETRGNRTLALDLADGNRRNSAYLLVEAMAADVGLNWEWSQMPPAAGMWGTDPDLVARPLDFSGPELERFLQTVLRWSAGERTWATAVLDALAEDDIPRAARLATHEDALLAIVAESWDARLALTRQRIEEVSSRRADVPEEVWTAVVSEPLERLVSIQNEEKVLSIDELADIPTALLGRRNTILADLDSALALAEQEGRDRARQRDERLEELRARGRALLDGLSEHPDYDSLEAHIQQLNQLFIRAIRAKDLEALAHAVRHIELAQAGGAPTHLPPPYDAVVREPRSIAPRGPASDAARPTARASISMNERLTHPLEWRDLTPLTIADLPGGSLRTPPLELGVPPSRDWARGALDAQVREAAEHIDRNPKCPALGVWLTEKGKLALLDQKFGWGLAYFTDAWRWVCQPEIQAPEPWAADIAWGALVSLLLPYLPEAEQQAITTPGNLDALMHRPFGDLPFASFERYDVLPTLGRWIAGLPTNVAIRFLRTSVGEWLVQKPVAGAEVLRGMFETEEHLDRALVLAAWLAPLLVPEDARLSQALAELAQNIPKTAAERTARIRRVLGEVADDNLYAGAIVDAVEGFNRSPGAAPEYDIVHRLLTPQIEIGAGDRLVIEITRPQGARALHSVHPLVNLRLSERTAATLLPANRIARILPDDRLDIVTCLTPAAVTRPGEERRLDVAYDVEGWYGPSRRLSSRLQSFSVTVTASVAREPLPNPYVVGRALQRDEAIVGRKELVQEIIDTLVGRDQDNAVLLLGDRRVGKTTVLNKVLDDRRIQQRYIGLAIDLESLATGATPEGFYQSLLLGPMQRRLDKVDIRVRLDPDPFQASPHEAFKHAMAQIDEQLSIRQRRLLVVLDEMERLFLLIESGGLGEEVVATLRSVILSCRNVSFLLAGVTDVLQRNTTRTQNRLFKLALSISVPPLPEDAVRVLVTKPASATYTLSRGAEDLLVRETGRHPYLVQHICHELYLYAVKHKLRLVCMPDVEHVIEGRILGSAAFGYLLDALSDSEDFLLARGIAALQAGRSYVSIADLVRQLQRMGEARTPESVRVRLRECAEERLVTVFDKKVASREHFRLSIGLFARYLRRRDEGRPSLVIRR